MFRPLITVVDDVRLILFACLGSTKVTVGKLAFIGFAADKSMTMPARCHCQPALMFGDGVTDHDHDLTRLPNVDGGATT